MIFGSENGETIRGGNQADSLYGMEGGDTLIGYAGKDHLEGGEGADILIGGAEDDILIGGAGIDTYVINRGDGHDTIVDEGRNILKIDGETFAGVFVKEEGSGNYVFTSDDRSYTMSFNSPATLTIDGSPCYDIGDLARSLGISEEEARRQLAEKEARHGVSHGLDDEDTTTLQ